MLLFGIGFLSSNRREYSRSLLLDPGITSLVLEGTAKNRQPNFISEENHAISHSQGGAERLMLDAKHFVNWQLACSASVVFPAVDQTE